MVDTPSVLDCNIGKVFWIHWNGTGLMEVGKGPSIGKNAFLTWVDPDPHAITSFEEFPVVPNITWEYLRNEGTCTGNWHYQWCHLIFIARTEGF